MERVLVTRNRESEGLGLALPAGKVALFGHYGDRRILLGEGSIDDYTIGEKVEFKVGSVPSMLAQQTANLDPDHRGYTLTVSNDSPQPQAIEIELPLEAKARQGGRLNKRDGWMVWRTTVPANGTATLSYRL